MQTMTRPRVTAGPVAAEPALRGCQPLLLAQGGYYLLTALWAIVDIDSFQAVTGLKTDLWMVRTVSALVAVVAAVLLFAARKPWPPAEVILLAVGCAVALAAVDVVFVSARVISPVYLLDAGAEVVLLAWWAFTALSREDDLESDRT